jgi:PAS domain S-box-containing protein
MKFPNYRTELRVTVLYAVFGSLWILLSDRIVAAIITDPKVLTTVQTFKGWLFVLLSSLLIYWHLRHALTLNQNSEKALKVSKENYRSLAETSDSAIAVLGREGTIWYANPTSIRIWDDPDLIGKTIFDLFPKEQASRYSAVIRRVIDKQIVDLNELEVHIRGRAFWFRISMSPLQNPTGPVNSLLLNAWDLTERKQAEMGLRESEERYRLLFEVVPHPMWVYDLETLQFLAVNNAAISNYGYSRDEFLSMTIRDIFPPQNISQLFENSIEDAEKTRLRQQIKKDGSLAQVEMTSHEILFGGRRAEIVLAHDVTRRIEMEGRIQRRVQELEALYLSGIAFSQTLVPGEIGRIIIEVLSDRLNWHHAAVRVRRGDGQEVEMLAFENIDEQEDESHFKSAITKTGEGLAGWVIERGDLIISNDLENDPRYKATYLGMKSGMYVPIKIQGKTIGCVSAESEKENAFTGDDERLLTTLATQAAAAFENANLFKNLQNELLERRQTEKALADSEERYRSLIDQIPAAVYLDDLQVEPASNRFVSPYIFDLFGYTPEEWIAGGYTLWVNSIHPEDRQRVVDFYAENIKSGSSYDQDYRMQTRAGDIIWIHDTATIMRDETGEPISMQGIVFNITDRKNSEITIHQQLKRLAALWEIDQTITSTFDIQVSLKIVLAKTLEALEVDAATVLRLNPATQMLDYAARLGFHSHELETASVTLEDSYAGKAVLGRETVRLPDLNKEATNRFLHGFLKEEGFVSYFGVPLIVKGQVIGVLEVFHRSVVERDQEWFDYLKTLAGQAGLAIDNAQLFSDLQHELQERKVAEEKLISSYAELEKRIEERTADLKLVNLELERALRVKDEFLASMSHELRTPLTGILGLSEAMQLDVYGPMNERQNKVLADIHFSGRHLLDLINDILDISKIEAGKFELQMGICTLKEICESSIQMTKGMSNKKQQEVEFTSDGTNVVLKGDSRRLKQVFVNLLSNAVKFTPEHGRVGMNVAVNRESHTVNITVWDEGIGISSENIKKLFQPFVQIDSRLAREQTGSGLGLALVKRLVEMHNGNVYIESAPKKGSQFTVSLPYLSSGSSQGQSVAAPVKFTKEVLRDAFAGTILLVEDNEVNIMVVSDFLKANNYHVISLTGANDLLSQVREVHPDLILMDIQMPGIDGLEATRSLRRFPDTQIASIPIIAVTALVMPGDREKCLEAGANEYISKPISLTKLLELVNQFVKKES